MKPAEHFMVLAGKDRERRDDKTFLGGICKSHRDLDDAQNCCGRSSCNMAVIVLSELGRTTRPSIISTGKSRDYIIVVQEYLKSIIAIAYQSCLRLLRR